MLSTDVCYGMAFGVGETGSVMTAWKRSRIAMGYTGTNCILQIVCVLGLLAGWSREAIGSYKQRQTEMLGRGPLVLVKFSELATAWKRAGILVGDCCT